MPTLPEDVMPETGTVLDEFLPIYRALAVHTDRRRGFSQDQVDGMDISVVAMLLGVTGEDPAVAAEQRELADLVRRRQAGEDVNWDDVLD